MSVIYCNEMHGQKQYIIHKTLKFYPKKSSVGYCFSICHRLSACFDSFRKHLSPLSRTKLLLFLPKAASLSYS